ncbi:DUF4221 family protein [Algoriphagus resistens]|uniref:DUF4221 family protein n=1 Tax=Algoriphagus resistens TaxID=1750590 RepID=UPI0007168AFF|nr:DUF4221 family protein [Algoriphagus resistens]
MNKTLLLFLLLLAVSVSCASKESAENTAATNSIEFSYEVDTVMVDAGDEFIYVNRKLSSSGLSPDGKYLYSFKSGSNDPG